MGRNDTLQSVAVWTYGPKRKAEFPFETKLYFVRGRKKLIDHKVVKDKYNINQRYLGIDLNYYIIKW